MRSPSRLSFTLSKLKSVDFFLLELECPRSAGPCSHSIERHRSTALVLNTDLECAFYTSTTSLTKTSCISPVFLSSRSSSVLGEICQLTWFLYDRVTCTGFHDAAHHENTIFNFALRIRTILYTIWQLRRAVVSFAPWSDQMQRSDLHFYRRIFYQFFSSASGWDHGNSGVPCTKDYWIVQEQLTSCFFLR